MGRGGRRLGTVSEGDCEENGRVLTSAVVGNLVACRRALQAVVGGLIERVHIDGCALSILVCVMYCQDEQETLKKQRLSANGCCVGRLEESGVARRLVMLVEVERADLRMRDDLVNMAPQRMNAWARRDGLRSGPFAAMGDELQACAEGHSLSQRASPGPRNRAKSVYSCTLLLSLILPWRLPNNIVKFCNAQSVLFEYAVVYSCMSIPTERCTAFQ